MRRPITSLTIVAILLAAMFLGNAKSNAADSNALVTALLASPVEPSELPPGATIGEAQLVEGASTRVDWFGTGLGATWINVPMRATQSPAVARAKLYDAVLQYAVFPTAADAFQALTSSELQSRVNRVSSQLGGTVIEFERIDQQLDLTEPALGWVAAGSRSGQSVWGNSVTSYSEAQTAAAIVAQSGNVLVLAFLHVSTDNADQVQIDPTPTVQFVAALAVAGVHQVGRLASASSNATSGQATAADESLGIGLGGNQETFEAKYPAPDSTVGATDFAVGDEYSIAGYKSVFVYWHKGYSAHIVLNARGGWTLQKAVDIANRFLPPDFQQSGKATGMSDGSVLTLGHSEALSTRFSAKTYIQYGVGGVPGDIRTVFLPTAGMDKVATIDIAIGVGDELGVRATSKRVETPAATKTTKSSSAETTYLKTVRKNVDALQKSVDTFDSLIQKAQGGGSFTKQDQDDLTTVLTQWLAAPADASSLTAPSAFAELQTVYEQAANDLSGASIDISNYFTNGGNDSSLAQSAEQRLSSAKSELQQADQLLTAAGA